MLYRQKQLEYKYGERTPYDAFSIKKKKGKAVCNKVVPYLALSHFNYNQANAFYGDSTFATTKIIKALIYWNEKNRDDKEFIQFVEEIIRDGSEDELFFKLVFTELLPNYSLRPEWISGITQGKLISLLVRAYWLTRIPRYKTLAKKTLETLKIPISNGGCYREINDGLIWIEEYPDLTRPSMVLNGHLFTIIGIGDYLQLDKSLEISKLYDNLILSTLSYIDRYFHDNVILYSMHNWKPCNVHYLTIMQPLANHMYKMTELSNFKEIERWLHRECPKNVFQKISFS